MHVGPRILEAAGFPIGPGASIVDLGCGGGQVVRELRALGLGAYGCDFGFTKDKTGTAAALEAEGVLRRVRKSPYRLPFEDASVSHVFSETVMEHVGNLDETLAELARITRDDGACLHLFPARLSPLEPHVAVPFGGVIRAYPYLLACAALGFRLPRERGQPARQVASKNHEFLGRTHYLTARQIEASYRRHFADVRFVEDLYFRVADRPRVRALARFPAAALIYRTLRANVVLTARPIRRIPR